MKIVKTNSYRYYKNVKRIQLASATVDIGEISMLSF
jgi:hypothetical protein